MGNTHRSTNVVMGSHCVLGKLWRISPGVIYLSGDRASLSAGGWRR